MKRKKINPEMAMMAARALAPKPMMPNPVAAAPMPPPAGLPGAMPGMKKGGASKLFKGKETYAEEIKEAKAIKSGKITPKEYAQGEESEKKMKRGGKCMASGGKASQLSKANGIAIRGKTRGKIC